MTKYSYKIELSAQTEGEADKKMKALMVLAKKLSTRELEKLADVIEHDPVKTAFAKKALGV